MVLLALLQPATCSDQCKRRLLSRAVECSPGGQPPSDAGKMQTWHATVTLSTLTSLQSECRQLPRPQPNPPKPWRSHQVTSPSWSESKRLQKLWHQAGSSYICFCEARLCSKRTLLTACKSAQPHGEVDAVALLVILEDPRIDLCGIYIPDLARPFSLKMSKAALAFSRGLLKACFP